jgi:uncharacterized membrane protein
MENTNTQTTASDDLSKYVKDNDVLLKGIVMWILLPLIGPLFFLNDTNPLVKFNAKQSIYVALAELIIGTLISICMIPLFFLTFGLISIVFVPLTIVPIVLHIFMLYKMNKGKKYYLPYIGKLSE